MQNQVLLTGTIWLLSARDSDPCLMAAKGLDS